MNDFTPAQAKRWVEQELAKCDNEPKRMARIDTETRSIEVGKSLNLNMPNSLWAHEELIRRLVALLQ